MINGYPRGPIHGDDRCPNCKESLPDNWKYCPVCGYAKSPVVSFIWTLLFVFLGLPLALVAACALLTSFDLALWPIPPVIFIIAGAAVWFITKQMRRAVGLKKFRK